MTVADAERAEMEDLSCRVLDGIRAHSERRQVLHDAQLAIWERHLTKFLEVGPATTPIPNVAHPTLFTHSDHTAGPHRTRSHTRKGFPCQRFPIRVLPTPHQAGFSARLELVLHEGNAKIFDEFRSILAEQRATSEQDLSSLSKWALASQQAADNMARRPLAEVRALTKHSATRTRSDNSSYFSFCNAKIPLTSL